MKIKGIKPTGDRVLLEPQIQKEIGGIVLPEESLKQSQRGTLKGKIIAVGPKVRDCHVGETVLFYKHRWTTFDSPKVKTEEGQELLLLSEKEILLSIEE